MSKTLQSRVTARAIQILSSKTNWTRFRSARTRRGDACTPWSPGAVRFCAWGALARAAYEITSDANKAREIVRSLETQLSNGKGRLGARRRLCQINDEKGYATIIRLLREAADAL